jgi:c-di-GMP-binding flagellar brake protein YcgR
MSWMREQRLNGRRPVRYSVKGSCQIVRERDFQLVADRIENLSTWGMLVGPADPVLTGERVLVSFEMPGDLGWFDAYARVTRVLHGRRAQETTRKLGLEFEELRPYDRYRLRQACEGTPPIPRLTRPGRRVGGFSLAALFPTVSFW